KVVRRADAEVVHARVRRTTAELFEMPIEPLEFGEEPDIEGVPVEDADGIVRVDRGNHAVAGGGNRLQMAGRDDSADAGHCEVVHPTPPPSVPARALSTCADARR